MEEIKKKLLTLDNKTVYLHDISKGEKIYKINEILYKNSDNYLQGICRFFLRESKDTTRQYLDEIIDELTLIKQEFNNKGFKYTTYSSKNNELLNNKEYNYVIQIFTTLKERFISILNNYDNTYNVRIDDVRTKLINSMNSQ